MCATAVYLISAADLVDVRVPFNEGATAAGLSGVRRKHGSALAIQTTSAYVLLSIGVVVAAYLEADFVDCSECYAAMGIGEDSPSVT